MEPVPACFPALEAITVIYMQHFISLPEKTKCEAKFQTVIESSGSAGFLPLTAGFTHPN